METNFELVWHGMSKLQDIALQEIKFSNFFFFHYLSEWEYCISGYYVLTPTYQNLPSQNVEENDSVYTYVGTVKRTGLRDYPHLYNTPMHSYRSRFPMSMLFRSAIQSVQVRPEKNFDSNPSFKRPSSFAHKSPCACVISVIFPRISSKGQRYIKRRSSGDCFPRFALSISVFCSQLTKLLLFFFSRVSLTVAPTLSLRNSAGDPYIPTSIGIIHIILWKSHFHITKRGRPAYGILPRYNLPSIRSV